MGLKEQKLEFKPIMAATEGGVTFVKAKGLVEGTIVAEGIYAGSQPNTFNKDKSDYRIEDLKDRSKLTIVNGAGNLGFQMNSLVVGDICRITYNGMKAITGKKSAFAGKMSHNFTVEKA